MSAGSGTARDMGHDAGKQQVTTGRPAEQGQEKSPADHDSGEDASNAVAQSETKQGEDSPKVFFVYDEISIVVSTSCVVDDERRDAIYDAVRLFLNEAIGRSVTSEEAQKEWEVTDTTSFKQFLRLSDGSHPDLCERIRTWWIPERDGLLQPLERRSGRIPASLSFDRRDGTTTLLNVYQVGGKETNKRFELVQRNKHIRHLVLHINTEIAHRRAGRSVEGGWQIVGATPNWFAGSSGEHGSPAAPPEPPPQPPGLKEAIEPPEEPKETLSGTDVDEHLPSPSKKPTKWEFRFDGTPEKPEVPNPQYPRRTQLQGMVDQDRAAAAKGECSNVIVAILDTCPSKKAVYEAKMAFPTNILLQQVVGKMDPWGREFSHPLRAPVNPVRIDGTLSLSPDDFDHLQEILPDWRERNADWYKALRQGRTVAVREPTYAMPDHGLFIAGIVKDIVPTAEIHLIRVMDTVGMADLLNVAAVLSVLPTRLLHGKEDPRRLIVNLSLTFSVPTFEEMLDEYLTEEARRALERLARGDVKTFGRVISDLRAMHDTLHGSLGDIIRWLGEKGVLVVAAAGNYNRDGAPRPSPRFPAFYDDTLGNIAGVAAMTVDFEAARYSNLAEENIVRRYSHGIATLGGDTVPVPHEDKPSVKWPHEELARIEDESDRRMDAIFGIFSAVDLPFMPTTVKDSDPPEKNKIGDGSNRIGWVAWVGTSFATPIISAIAALVWERKPDLTPGKVIDAVQIFADIPLRDLNCEGIYTYQEGIRPLP